ncbi:MAG: endopolygalacturonase, partial [Spirochaetaceae bacterium]
MNTEAYTIRPDSGVDFSTEVQRALDARRRVHIASGSYVVQTPLRLPSGARIIADSDAVIVLGDGVCKEANDYLLSNANPISGDTDIHVSGGVWDGNNRGNPRPGGGLFADGYTGAMFHFENVEGLRIDSLCMRNAEAYHLRITGVTRFHIEEISFDSDRVRPNNDGVHLGGNCTDGVIRHIRGLSFGVTNDDLVALNADDGLNRNEVRGMQGGPIRRVRIEHLRAEGVHCFVRLLSVHSPIEDVHIEDVEGTTRNTVINCDGCRRCRVQLFDPDSPPFADGIGTLRNITIRSLRVGPATDGEHTESAGGEPLPLFR